MMKTIAKRTLFYSDIGSSFRRKLVINVGCPYLVDQNKVDFPIGEEGLVGCHIETEGLDVEYRHEVYGVDEIQAVNIATNIEPFLTRLNKKYNLFWESGEPYFDNE